MLRIGKLTDYAMLIMSKMAGSPHAVLSAALIADMLQLSVPTVSKILKMLSDAGLVSSVRGAEGGYHLAREAKFISLADIITAMEGDLALTECCESFNHCGISTSCQLRDNWRKINNRVRQFLGNVTIADMLKPLMLAQLEVLVHE
jgi:FeS assembly SUF system regulator